MFKYVVITPARNEAAFLRTTIQAMVNQTALPAKWIIVSDGSTDDTDSIVCEYASQHPWIELVRAPEHEGRSFSGKVRAFNIGYARLQPADYDVIGCLDADISFGEDYFEFLLDKLASNPALGLVGTPFKDETVYDYRFVNIEHVSGACQLFRRQCFEDIGGYTPVKGGGIDLRAVLTARMKGWKTRTFTERISTHHRVVGTAHQGQLTGRFKYGVKDYAFGNHPLWELCRVAYQMTKPPFLLGGVALGMGYAWSAIRRVERPVSAELVAFNRREQVERLTRFFRTRLMGAAESAAVPRG
jgi:poly-beta-1,6-N-acetyl-D-glucosamine synthase